METTMTHFPDYFHTTTVTVYGRATDGYSAIGRRMTLANSLLSIKDGIHPPIMNYRAMRQKDPQAAKRMKTQIDAIFPAIYKELIPAVPEGHTPHESNCLKENFLETSGLVIVDIDGLSTDTPQYQALIEEMMFCPELAFRYTSPSGNGFKIGFRIPSTTCADEGQRLHKAFYRWLAKNYPLMHSLRDPAIENNPWSRCYYSMDPTMFILDEDPPEIDITAFIAKTANKLYIPPSKETMAVEERLLDWLILGNHCSFKPVYTEMLLLASITANYNRKDLFLYAMEHLVEWDLYAGKKSWTSGAYEEERLSKKWDVVYDGLSMRPPTVKKLNWDTQRTTVFLEDVPLEFRGIISFPSRPNVETEEKLLQLLTKSVNIYGSIGEVAADLDLLFVDSESVRLLMKATARYNRSDIFAKVLLNNNYSSENVMELMGEWTNEWYRTKARVAAGLPTVGWTKLMETCARSPEAHITLANARRSSHE